MLLGSEFETLSKIARQYTRHSVTGLFQFSEKDYATRFPEDHSLNYLQKLINKGYAGYSSKNQVIIDSYKWVHEFTKYLEAEIHRRGYKYTLEYNLKENIIEVKENNIDLIKFHINFVDEVLNEENVINFVYVSTFDSYVYWLDLVNDPLMFDMFLHFINKQINAFKYSNRIRFSFFENLDISYLSEIFNVSIPEYFKQGKFIISKPTEEHLQNLFKLYKESNINAFSVNKGDISFFICKFEDRIEFISFNEEGNIMYTQSTLNEINNLEKLLRIKVSNFRRIILMQNNKITDNARKTTQIAGMLLTPINLFILFGISPLGLTWVKKAVNSTITYILMGVLLILITLGYVFWLVIPSIRLFRFNWSLKYEK